MPHTNTQCQISLEYLDFDDYNGVDLENYVPVTQTLFDNDEQWEYIVENWEHLNGQDWYSIVSYSVVQEDGTVLFTTPDETDSQGNSLSIGYLYLIKILGNYYLAAYYHSSVDEADNVGKTVLFMINHQTQSIQRVDTELPFNVFPSIAERSQDIIIELGEGTNATEISVIDANGRVLNTISVQQGQREVKIPASTMGHSLNLLNVRERQRQATKKIIVK